MIVQRRKRKDQERKVVEIKNKLSHNIFVQSFGCCFFFSPHSQRKDKALLIYISQIIAHNKCCEQQQNKHSTTVQG